MVTNAHDLEARLSGAWHALAEPYHCRMTRSAFFEGIVKRYHEPHRHYHTLEHIAEMLAIIDRHRARLLELEALGFATWFHDVIYDPRQQDNETRSAQLARRTMRRLMVPGWMSLRTSALILSTRDHEPPDPSFDAALFIDADLAILGADPERYRRYADDIRREYAHVDDIEYRNGRRALLERYLGRQRIFHTDVMLADYEEPARENIRAELSRLAES
jgi:predicted metal-dependent HD superfamily phosphohydrolase